MKMALYVQKFLRHLFLLWFRARNIRLVVEGNAHIPQNRAALIIAINHQTVLDPFVAAVALPRALYPVHFLGARWFLSPILFFLALIGIVPFFYKLCGVITVYRGRGIEKNIAPAVEILKKNGIIALFPEGKRDNTNSTHPFKRGVAVLMRLSRAPILPLHIAYDKKDVHVTAGPLLYITTDDEREEDTLERIHDACAALGASRNTF